MIKISHKIREYCKDHLYEIFFIIITLLALFIRIMMFDFKTSDYGGYLKPWFDNLKEAGGLKGLATYSGDYNLPYITILALLTYLPFNSLYSIKAVSIIFDFLLATSIGKLTSYLSKDNKKIMFLLAYLIVLFIPSVLLNSAMWGQCDSIYTFFTVCSILYLLKEKYVKSFIMLGIAFSFKLQTIFIIPFYIVYYVCKKKYSILNFFIIPISDLILCIPALIAGRPFIKCIDVYFNQTETYAEHLTLNFLNIYCIFNGYPYLLSKVGEIFAVVICGLVLFYCVYKKVEFNNEEVITLSLWFLIIMTFVLPSMHERYLYTGEALAVAYLLVYRKNYGIMSYVILSTILTYGYALFNLEIENKSLIVMMYLILIIIFTIRTIKLLNKE